MRCSYDFKKYIYIKFLRGVMRARSCSEALFELPVTSSIVIEEELI
jgi:hypothetical protein